MPPMSVAFPDALERLNNNPLTGHFAYQIAIAS